MKKILLGFLIGFFVITVIALLIFFTVIKNKMCNGQFVKCPSGNVSICSKKGTNAGQFCPKRTGEFRSGVGPGNGQCVGPAPSDRKIKHMYECERQLEMNLADYGHFWNDTQQKAGDTHTARDGAFSIYNDIVATAEYPCNSPGIITNSNPREGEKCPDN
jgi:hypothetical protein